MTITITIKIIVHDGSYFSIALDVQHGTKIESLYYLLESGKHCEKCKGKRLVFYRENEEDALLLEETLENNVTLLCIVLTPHNSALQTSRENEMLEKLMWYFRDDAEYGRDEAEYVRDAIFERTDCNSWDDLKDRKHEIVKQLKKVDAVDQANILTELDFS